MLFASKQSSTYTGGAGVTANIDSIVEVQRNGYSCRQIPISESKWAADSSSLKYATSKHPVWWFDSNVVKILPEPSGSEDGYYYYIDSTEINDNSDLRNVVVNYASSKEFTKLSITGLPDWSNIVSPVLSSLSTVSFTDTGLTFTAVEPSSISITTVNYTAASQTSTEDIAPPVFIPPDDISTFESFEDWWNGSEDANPFGDNDPGIFSITSVPPTPPSTTISSFGTAPSYTQPRVTGDEQELTATMVAGAIGTGADFLNFEHWYDVLADMIETEEDTELAQAQLGKIQSYIQAYGQAMQNQLNVFNDANVEYQATIQKNMTEKSLDLQKYQNDLSLYQANVNKEVQDYTQKLAKYQLELGSSYTAWVESENNKIARFQANLTKAQAEYQNDSDVFNGELQRKINNAQEANKIALANADKEARDAIENNNIQLAKYQAESQNYNANIQKEINSYTAKLQGATQDMQVIIQNNQDKLATYGADLQKYQAEIAKENQKTALNLQKSQMYQAESQKYYEWAINEIQSYVQNNSKMIGMQMATQAQSRGN